MSRDAIFYVNERGHVHRTRHWRHAMYQKVEASLKRKEKIDEKKEDSLPPSHWQKAIAKHLGQRSEEKLSL